MSGEPSPDCMVAAPPRPKIVIGSRGSELARAQTNLVIAALQRAWPELEIETEILNTTGDRSSTSPVDPRAGRKGSFTREIERALSAGQIDVAVHSAKDLPSEETPGLEVGSVLPRAMVDDVLVQKVQTDPTSFPDGATIATGSVRRQHQLRWKHPGVQTVDLRGNVPTRLRRLITNGWDAIVLARAGLERLGYNVSAGQVDFEGVRLYTKVLSNESFLSAGGQGVIAMQLRTSDSATRRTIDRVNHEATSVCLRAERRFLRFLDGDCNSPVGVLGTMQGEELTLRAQVFDGTNVTPKTGKVSASWRAQGPEAVSGILYRLMYEQR